MEHHHFHEAISSGKPLAHDSLEELLSSKELVFLGKFETEGAQHFCVLLLVAINNELTEFANGVHDELCESSSQGFTIFSLTVNLPFFSYGIKEVISPKLLHHLFLTDSEFLGVESGELGETESPLVLSRSEGDITDRGIDLDFSHIFTLISGNDDVGHIDHTEERVVHGFTVKFEFEDGSIDLVDHEDGSDFFLHSLSEHSLCLDRHTFNSVDDNQGTVSDTESSSDF